MTLVMGVDSSTQSTKVEVRNASTGELVASGRAAHKETRPPVSEQNPGDWWQALRDAIAEARVDDVAAISIAAQQHGMVVLDESNQPVRPAKLWNDLESAPDATDLVNALGPAKWAEGCGSVPLASFTISKLAWLRRVEPENFRALSRLLLPHDWLTLQLAGVAVTDRGDASGTGYWSPQNESWSRELLDLVDDQVDWASALPTVLGPLEAAGEVTSAASEAVGLAPGTIVAPGTGDNMAAALGLGLATEDAAISIGTSGTVFAVADSPSADPSGTVAGFADASGRFLPLVCTLNAARVTDTFSELLGISQHEMAAMALAADMSDVVLVPYLDGERTPNRPTATGTLSGIRTSTTREQIARAAFEGVACGLLDALDALGTEPERIFLIGGGSRSPAYQKAVADLSGRVVTVPAEPEQVALGACVQAAATLASSDPGEIAREWNLGHGREINPDPTVDASSVRARYAAASSADRD